jgi:hypothetical protein
MPSRPAWEAAGLHVVSASGPRRVETGMPDAPVDTPGTFENNPFVQVGKMGMLGRADRHAQGRCRGLRRRWHHEPRHALAGVLRSGAHRGPKSEVILAQRRARLQSLLNPPGSAKSFFFASPAEVARHSSSFPPVCGVAVTLGYGIQNGIAAAAYGGSRSPCRARGECGANGNLDAPLSRALEVPIH